MKPFLRYWQIRWFPLLVGASLLVPSSAREAWSAFPDTEALAPKTEFEGKKLARVNIALEESNFYDEIARRLDAPRSGIPSILGVAGGSGVGKSTYATGKLKRELEARGRSVLVLSMDDFMNHPDIRESLETAGNEWGPEHVSLNEIRRVLGAIRDGVEEIETNKFVRDPVTGARVERRTISLVGHDTVVFEGLWAISDHPNVGSLSEFMDLSIYIDARIEDLFHWRWEREQEKGVLARSREEFQHHWENGIVPDTQKYIQPSKVNADFVVTLDANRNPSHAYVSWLPFLAEALIRRPWLGPKVPSVSLGEARSIAVDHYGHVGGNEKDPEMFDGGYFTHNVPFLFHRKDRDVVLKAEHAHLANVELAVSAAKTLSDRDIAGAVTVIPNAAGQPITTRNEKHYVAYDYSSRGRKILKTDAGDREWDGLLRAMAESLEALSTLPRPGDVLPPSDDPRPHLYRNAFIDHYDRLRVLEGSDLSRREQLYLDVYDQLILPNLDILEDSLPAETYENLPHQVTHGDFKFDNVLFDQDGEVVTLFDFYNVGWTPRIKEFMGPVFHDNPETYRKEDLIRAVVLFNKHSPKPLSEEEVRKLPEILRGNFLERVPHWFWLPGDRGHVNRIDDDGLYPEILKKVQTLRRFTEDFPEGSGAAFLGEVQVALGKAGLDPMSNQRRPYPYPSSRHATKKPIPTGGHKIEAAWMRDLIVRGERGIDFSTLKDPTQQYRLRVLPDVVTMDSDDDLEKPEYMIVVETIPKVEGDPIYPVGVMTSIFLDDADYLHLHWTAVLDYPEINTEVAAFLSYLRTSDDPALAQIGPTIRAHLSQGGYQILKAMKLYSMFNTEDEFHVQISLFLTYMIAAGVGDSDDEVLEYFEAAPSNLRGQGLGYAMGEFLSSFVPIGTQMKYGLGHGESREIVEEGGTFEETPRGRWWKKLGFDRTEDLGALTYILEKRRPALIASRWEEVDNLGEYILVPRGAYEKVSASDIMDSSL